MINEPPQQTSSFHAIQRLFWYSLYIFIDIHDEILKAVDYFFHHKSIFFFFILLYALVVSVGASFVLLGFGILSHSGILTTPNVTSSSSALINTTKLAYLGSMIYSIPFLLFLNLFRGIIDPYVTSSIISDKNTSILLFLILCPSYSLLSALTGRAILHHISPHDITVLGNRDAALCGIVAGSVLMLCMMVGVELTRVWMRWRVRRKSGDGLA
jgi:hypothetical protein